MKRQLWATVLAVAVLIAGSGRAQAQATVTTDQSDYLPGSTASIIGAGFEAGETVQLQVLRIDIPENSGPEHLPWEVVADGNGAFATSWYVTLDEWGATLEVTATGLTSGLTAQHVFTDSTVTAATGGGAISADTAGGAYTSITGPSITEVASGDIKAGTIVLNAPAGFAFDTGGTAPNVLLAAGDASNASKNINNATVGSTLAVDWVTATQIQFTITSVSSGQTRNVLTFQNIRVRPTAGTPLATGNITNSGTAVNIPTGTASFGTLTQVPGAPTKLAFGVQPTTTAADSAISPAVTVLVEDQFGNTVTGNTSTVTISSGNTSFTGDSTLSVAAVAGVATFSNLKPTTAGTGKTLTASDGSLTGATSSAFTVPNANPVATAKSFTRGRDLSLKILKDDLLAGATDPNGDTLTLSGVQNPSTGGATVTAPAGSWVFYLPNSLTNGAGNGDTFTYTLSDGHGGTGSATVTIYIQQQGGAAQQISYNAAGVTVTFAGIPGYTYDVQRSADVGFTSPAVLTTTQAPSAGVFTYTDSNPPNPGPSFYRLIQH